MIFIRHEEAIFIGLLRTRSKNLLIYFYNYFIHSLKIFLKSRPDLRWNTTVMLPIDRNVKSAHYPPQKD